MKHFSLSPARNPNNEPGMCPAPRQATNVTSSSRPCLWVRGWQRLPLGVKGMIVVAIPLATLMFASLLGAVIARQQQQAVGWLNHTQMVRVSVQEVYTLIAEASSGVRGFLLSQDSSFLAPYERGAAKLPAALTTLQTLVADNPAQTAKARQVDALAAQQLSGLEGLRLQSTRQPENNRSAALRAALTAHKQELDVLRALLDAMTAAEDELLRERAATVARLSRWQQRAGIGNLLLGLGGSFLAMLLFLRGIARRADYVGANAERLAAGIPLLAPISGSDALSRLSERLDATAALLRQQTQLLRDSEARLRHVVTNAPIVLHALDHKGVFVFSEGRGLEALGFNPGELVGHSVFDVYRDAPHILANNRSALAGRGFTTTVEVRGLTFETRYQPTFSSGAVSGVIIVATDVSERKEAEKTLLHYQGVLEHQNAELARVAQLKDEFVAKMSHELRTPLTAVIGFSELLRDESYVGPITPKQRDYVDIILDASAHLLTLINDLLDLSKIEAGMMILEPSPVDLRDAVANALTIIDGEARKKALQLEARLPAQLPLLSADARKVRQILYNLLSNAVKYTPSAGRVQLVVYDDGREVRIEVRDSGPGIPQEDQARLFQPFVQLKNPEAEAYEGTGLGLALTKQLVELHGGRVWLHSRVGLGSTFGFSLPRLEDAGHAGQLPA